MISSSDSAGESAALLAAVASPANAETIRMAQVLVHCVDAVVQIADQLILMMLPQLLLFGRLRSASPDS